MKFAKAEKSTGGARSTNFKGFGAGSKKGITADAKPGQNPVKTKGNTAKFSGGKKKVGK